MADIKDPKVGAKPGILDLIKKMKEDLRKPLVLTILKWDWSKVKDLQSGEENTKNEFTIVPVPYVKGSQVMAVGDDLVELEAENVDQIMFIGEAEEIIEFITDNGDGTYGFKSVEHLLDVTKPKLAWDRALNDFKVVLDSRVVLTTERLADFGRLRSAAGKAKVAEQRTTVLGKFMTEKAAKMKGGLNTKTGNKPADVEKT